MCNEQIEDHLACPDCKRRHTLAYFGSYKRYVLDVSKEDRITIRRVYCKVCRAHTHAIIPDICIPYKVVSLDLCAQVLMMRIGDHSVKEICSRCHISLKTLYKIISHTTSLAVAANGAGVDLAAFLEMLANDAWCAQKIFFSLFHRTCFSSTSSAKVTYVADAADSGFT